MPIIVTITKTLEDWWGAEECFRDGGASAVLELVKEDLAALLDDASFKITESGIGIEDDRFDAAPHTHQSASHAANCVECDHGLATKPDF